MKNTAVILFVKNLKARGVQKVYLNIALALQQKAIDVHFVIRENIIELDHSELKHFYIFENDTTKQLDQLIADEPITGMISNNVEFTEGLRNIDPEKIAHTVHMLWGRRLKKQFRWPKLFYLKRLYANKNIVAISNAVHDDLINVIGIKAKKITIIPDGFDFDAIDQLAAEPPEDELLKKPYIIAVGALSREKGYMRLLKVISQLNIPHHLYILGKGKQEKKLKQYIQSKQLQHRVTLLGHKKNPYPYIKGAKLLLASSFDEALHGVVVEALSLKTPVVSTDSKGVLDVMKGDMTEYVVSNDTDFKLKIAQALHTYPDIPAVLVEPFNYKSVGDQYLRLFDE